MMFLCEVATNAVWNKFPRIVPVQPFDCPGYRRTIVKTFFENIDSPANTFRAKFTGGQHRHVGTVDRCAATVLSKLFCETLISFKNTLPQVEIFHLGTGAFGDTLLH